MSEGADEPEDEAEASDSEPESTAPPVDLRLAIVRSVG
jgi:hypothetical protein